MKKDAIFETGKNIQVFSNLLLVIILLNQFLKDNDTIVLIYGFIAFIMLYSIGFIMIWEGSNSGNK